MKAKDLNGKIVKGLPKYYKHWAGGFKDEPDSVHEAEGFFEIIFPEFDSDIQERGQIYFDETNKVFTFPVIDKALDIEAIRAQKHEQFTHIVEGEMTDALKVGILGKLAMGEPVPWETKEKITALRERETQVKTLIDSITDPVTLVKFTFDREEIEADKEELKSARKL